MIHDDTIHDHYILALLELPPLRCFLSYTLSLLAPLRPCYLC